MSEFLTSAGEHPNPNQQVNMQAAPAHAPGSLAMETEQRVQLLLLEIDELLTKSESLRKESERIRSMIDRLRDGGQLSLDEWHPGT